jgi:SAM-dependent methyltransferase
MPYTLLNAPGADSAETVARTLAGDRLALRLLETTVNVDPVLEGVLTGVRRWLLSYAGADLSESPMLDFTCALAQQCFANEFVFAEGEAEATALSAQVLDLNDALAGDGADGARLPGLVARIALYRPLSGLESAAALAARWQTATWPAPMGALIERALLAPREEARLGAEIPRATGITDTTSVAVKAQYEQNPYPRWLAVPQREKRAYGRFLSRRFPHFKAPPRLDEAVNVLVAGCGTGLEAVAVATGRVCARVTAVDLSRQSLAYGLRMARALGVANLEFLEADVLEMASLGGRYEVVESSGVLHHLAEPWAGLKALSECLVAGGVMKIGLYSQRARAAVVAAREAIREAGLTADAEGIRRIRARIFEAAPDDPLHQLAGSEDLYTTSACRDLLFHVCEHRFTPAQIGEALEALALDFIGFELPYPFIRTQYLAFNSGDKEMRDLDAWTRFETRHPDTFAAMYVFWCHRPE